MRGAANPIKIFLFLFSALIFIRPFISEMAYPVLDGYIRISMLVIFILAFFSVKKFNIPVRPLGMQISLYIAAIGLSLLSSINSRTSLHQLYQLAPLLCLFIFASNLEEKNSLRLIRLTLYSGLILSVYGIYQYIWGFEHTKEYINLYLREMLQTRYVREILLTRRAISAFFSPNIFASYLAMTLPVCGGLLLDNIKNRRSCIFPAIYLIFAFAAIILTKSIAGWVSLIFGSLIFISMTRHIPKRITLLFLVSFLAISLSLFIMRYDTFINLENQQNTLLQRLGFWRTSFLIIKDFPVKGVGLGNLGNIYAKYRGIIANETMFSHNMLLQIWAETGILGISSIIFLLIAFIKRSIEIEKTPINIGIITSSAIFIINNMIDYSYFIPQASFLWWLNLGLLSQGLNEQGNKRQSKIRPLAILAIMFIIILSARSFVSLLYFQKGNYKKAIAWEPCNDLYYAYIKDYHKAIALNPYYPFYHRDLALAYLNKNMIKEAVSEFEKASRLYPANVFLHQWLLDLYMKTGETEKAREQKAEIEKFKAEYTGYFMR